MRKKFVFATNNSHKLEEVTAILGEKVELLSMKDIKCDTDIPETADTLMSSTDGGGLTLLRKQKSQKALNPHKVTGQYQSGGRYTFC